MTIKTCLAGLLALGWLAAAPAPALAQQAAPTTVGIRGFVDVGRVGFDAEQSFKAIFGDAGGPSVGFGGELRFFRDQIFVQVEIERFKKDGGERVFVFDDQVFPLGIPTEVTVMPILFTAGYRFTQLTRIVPYVGGGFGSYRYEETSAFADADENVDERFTGYHLVGGVEVPIWRWVGVAADVRWTSVPDALGSDPNGVSAAFDETNLGGTRFTVRFLVGR